MRVIIDINAFFNSLANVIPCPICKKHYSITLKDFPVRDANRNELTFWLFDFHNKVNKSLDKKELQFDEFIQIYKNMYSQTPEKSSRVDLYKNIILISLCVCFLFLCTKLSY